MYAPSIFNHGTLKILGKANQKTQKGEEIVWKSRYETEILSYLKRTHFTYLTLIALLT